MARKKEQNDKIRLSLEGVQIFKNQITKNIFEIPTKEEAEQFKKEFNRINDEYMYSNISDKYMKKLYI